MCEKKRAREYPDPNPYRELMKACQGCGNRLKVLKMCVCRKAWYCGRDCQLRDWPNHKAACKRAQKKAKASKTDQPGAFLICEEVVG